MGRGRQSTIGVSLVYVNKYNLYYIPINVISPYTFDFIECNLMLQITTLWFSESLSLLSETVDVVHNVSLNTQCTRYCDAPYKICTKW